MARKTVIFLFCLLINSTLFSITYKITPPSYNPGLFSVVNMIIGAFNFFEKSKDCTGLLLDFNDYDNVGFCYGQNWWEHYFEPIHLGTCEGQEKKFSNYKKQVFSLSAQFQMSRERGNELITKYITLKQEIQNKIDTFVKEHFDGNYVIGIHYRGTDKNIEAVLVPYEEVASLIKNEIVDHGEKNIKIFIATDEHAFLQFMEEEFPGKIVAINAIRSHNGVAVHISSENGYKKGEEALIDCILLSKCSKLYKTASNLSDVSMRFNPSLPVVHLNRAFYEIKEHLSDVQTTLNAVLSLLNRYEENEIEGFTINFSMRNSNWWENNFMPVSVGKNNIPEMSLYDLEVWGLENMYEMPAARAHELITKYLKLKPEVSEKINKIVDENFKNHYIIGIYYTNQGCVSYDEFWLQLTRTIAKAPVNYKIFLITHDNQLGNIINSHFSNIINTNIIDSLQPNCLGDIILSLAILLSKSNVIIGSASTYLNMLSQLNPNVPVIKLGQFWLEKD